MRIAITGSNGYVGNVLAAHFSRSGVPVLGIDIASMTRQRFYRGFTFRACDVRDRAKVQGLFEEFRPTHVFHLAFLMDPQHDRAFEDDVDVNGSKSVFDAANAVPSVQQFVHFSSASVYGGFPDNEPWIPETQEPRPRDWAYAQNKVAAERYMMAAQKRSDLRLVNLRMCTAVGPSYYKEGGVVRVLARSPFGLLLDGKDTALQFIHEEDVTALMDRIVEDDAIEGTYNLAPDSFAMTRELNPRKWKLFLRVPKRLFRWIVAMLWRLRVSSVSPTSVNLVAHGIVISPEKLIRRYGYGFRFSTKEAFYDAYVQRSTNGTL